jgi:hypothetical protein
VLYTVSGPYPKAQLAAIARSLRPVAAAAAAQWSCSAASASAFVRCTVPSGCSGGE